MSKGKTLVSADELLAMASRLRYHLTAALFEAHQLHRYTGQDGLPLLTTQEMVVIGMHLTAERLLGAMPRLSTAFRVVSAGIYGDLCKMHEELPGSPQSDAGEKGVSVHQPDRPLPAGGG